MRYSLNSFTSALYVKPFFDTRQHFLKDSCDHPLTLHIILNFGFVAVDQVVQKFLIRLFFAVDLIVCLAKIYTQKMINSVNDT